MSRPFIPPRSCRLSIIGCSLLALLAACHGVRAELPAVGVNAGAPIWGGSVLFTDALAADIAGSGCRAVRINFRIDGNPTWTPAHLAKYDQIIQTARNHDLQVLGIIAYEAVYGGQVQWNENYDTTGMNAYIETFAETAYLLINRYKDQVKLFELWNEPDCWSVPPSTNPLNPGCFYIWPRNYANVLARTYLECIEQGGADFFTASGVSLVTGGLFGHDIGGGFSPSMTDYMNVVYQQTDIWSDFEVQTGRRYPWDYFGYHFYLNQGETVSTSELGRFFQNVRTWKSYYDDPTDILVTEFGWNTAAVTPELQAANLRDTYNWFKTQDDILTGYWYQWNDGDGGWGLVYSIGNPKPSYFELAAQCGQQPVFANFSADPVAGSAPLTVQFQNTSAGVIDTYTWDFGDGATSDETSPVHVYAQPGSYTVSLTATGPGGTNVETKPGFIVVLPPVNPADLDGDGDADLADLALWSPCFTGPGATDIPPGCGGEPVPTPAVRSWVAAGTLAGLPHAIANDDLLAGMIGIHEAGGFHGATPGGVAGGLADLTDGVAGENVEAVLADYSRPALRVRYEFPQPRNIAEIRVFAANSDSRLFQNYDIEVSLAGQTGFQNLAADVRTGPYGQVNDGTWGATVTTIAGAAPGGAIVAAADAVRFTFYDVSTVSPANVFWDPWDADEAGDTDGNPRAYVGPVIKEIDVFGAAAGNLADLDGDRDADADDFLIFEGVFTGPAGTP